MNDFIANIYELWGYAFLDDFSKYMYRAHLYPEIFWIMVISSCVLMFTYYKIDNIKWKSNCVWFGIIATIAIINGVFAFYIVDDGLYEYLFINHIKDTDIMTSDEIYFSLIAAGWTLVLLFLLSLGLKHISSNLRKTPF